MRALRDENDPASVKTTGVVFDKRCETVFFSEAFRVSKTSFALPNKGRQMTPATRNNHYE